MRRVAVLAAVVAAGWTGSASAATGPVHADGMVLRDSSGRQVLLRGFGLTDLIQFHWLVPRTWATYPRPGELRKLASMGANTLRLSVNWSELEPTRGRLDPAYLARIDTVLRQSQRLGIRVAIDFHQDAYGRAWGLDGAPDWSCAEPPVPGERTGATQTSAPVMACWTAFWTDSAGAQTAFVEMVGRVARRFAAHPALMGYDLLNEPHPANAAPDGNFEARFLRPFYRRAIRAIRAADPDTLLVIEPIIFRDLGLETAPLRVPGRNLVYGPHLYNKTDWIYDPPQTYRGGAEKRRLAPDYALAQKEARREGIPWLVGEQGIRLDGKEANGPAFIADELDLADRYLVSHWWWNAGRASPNGFNLVWGDGPWSRNGIREPLIAAWIRPYARATAGTLIEQRWNRDAGVFRLVYATRGVRLRSQRTIVFMPRRQFPTGYAASAEGAEVVSRPGSETLVLRNLPGRTRVALRVSRRR